MPEQFTALSVSEESIPLGAHDIIIIIALHNAHTVKVSSHHTATPFGATKGETSKWAC